MASYLGPKWFGVVYKDAAKQETLIYTSGKKKMSQNKNEDLKY